MDLETRENLSDLDKSAPPRFFQHEALINTIEDAKTLDQMELINTVNYSHFTGDPIFILLKHPVYQDKLLAKAHPEPCLDNQLTCRWDESFFQYKLESYHALHLVIMKNQTMIVAPINILSNGRNSFTIQLPEKSFVLNKRQVRRYP